jgi:hypothetical protein
MKNFKIELNEFQLSLLNLLISKGMKEDKKLTISDNKGNNFILCKECNKLDDIIEYQIKGQEKKEKIKVN